MIKYKLLIRLSEYTFGNVEDLKRKVREIMEVGIWAIETRLVNEDEAPEEEEKSEPEEPPKTKLKAKKSDAKKDLNRPKRKRRTKEEMDVVRKGEHIKEQGVPNKRTKYPKEMKEFIEGHMETNTNQEICDLINEKWDVDIILMRLNSYMIYNKLKRENIIRTPRRKKEEIKVKKTVGKPKKYTDEVLQFLRDNINNFSNKELCKQLDYKFNIKTTSDNVSQTMRNKGIKREVIPDGVDKEIVDFIMKSKIKDIYAMRDTLIERFEVYVPTIKLRNLMNQREENLPGESTEGEVLRIKKKREEVFGDENDIEDIL